MINEEELRALMEKEGYSQERADEICALLYTGDFVHDIQEMIEACIALLNQAVGAISGAMSELAGIYYTPGRPAALGPGIKADHGHRRRPGWPGPTADDTGGKRGNQ